MSLRYKFLAATHKPARLGNSCQQTLDERIHPREHPPDIFVVFHRTVLVDKFEPFSGNTERISEVVAHDACELLQPLVLAFEFVLALTEQTLAPYQKRSGFRKVEDWIATIKPLNSDLPETGYLYRATTEDKIVLNK